MCLQNKVAISTGEVRRIGRATAGRFAREVAKVVIWNVLEEGAPTAQSLRQEGFVAEFIPLSVTELPALEAAARAVVGQFGQIDILINDVGIMRGKTLLKRSSAEWQQVLNINLTGVFNGTKVVAPLPG